jgi:hypothetical protein
MNWSIENKIPSTPKTTTTKVGHFIIVTLTISGGNQEDKYWEKSVDHHFLKTAVLAIKSNYVFIGRNLPTLHRRLLSVWLPSSGLLNSLIGKWSVIVQK